MADEHAATKDASLAPTASAILGPFWRPDTPARAMGASICLAKPPDGEIVFMHGSVVSHPTGAPLPGASVEIWQASTNGGYEESRPGISIRHSLIRESARHPGMYEQQDDDQPEHNLRGVFKTDDDGRYALYCLRPTPYPVRLTDEARVVPRKADKVYRHWRSPPMGRLDGCCD